MGQSWYVRLGWWLCEKLGHPSVTKSGWIYEGEFHRDCNLCGRIVSEPIKRHGAGE